MPIRPKRAHAEPKRGKLQINTRVNRSTCLCLLQPVCARNLALRTEASVTLGCFFSFTKICFLRVAPVSKRVLYNHQLCTSLTLMYYSTFIPDTFKKQKLLLCGLNYIIGKKKEPKQNKKTTTTYYFSLIFLCRETRVELLTVHPCEGVCFAVNIHRIAKEREIINWSRRFAFLSRM